MTNKIRSVSNDPIIICEEEMALGEEPASTPSPPRPWTIKDAITSVIGMVEEVPSWPPDLYAVAATILAETGGYVHATHLGSGCGIETWNDVARSLASEWVIKDDLEVECIPGEVQNLWGELISRHDLDLSKVPGDSRICTTLVKLLAIADECSAGFGIDTNDPICRSVLVLLAKNRSASLTKNVRLDRARVLPKQHTPQTGLTLRSLSHHLALIRPRGVSAIWCAPLVFKKRQDEDIINILICPWPETTSEADFRTVFSVPDHQVSNNSVHRFFCFDPKHPDDKEAFGSKLSRRVAAGKRICGDIHLIVFPELSLSEDCLSVARRLANEHGAMLVAGVRRRDKGKRPLKCADGDELGATRNTCFVDSQGLFARGFEKNELDTLSGFKFGEFQDKHHRWSLDWRQVLQYGLGSRLPTSRQCWEWTPIRERRMHFWTISNWLTWAPLICEDLARQDPLQTSIPEELAPNLVMALLMDGPQLSK
ncbi:MAG: hypothetical protein R3F15_08870 [Lysobacterales bacterium]